MGAALAFTSLLSSCKILRTARERGLRCGLRGNPGVSGSRRSLGDVKIALSSRRNCGRFSELLKSWHFGSAEFLPYSGDIVSCCGRLVCEWEHLAWAGECVCLWTAAWSCTQWHTPPRFLPNLWYMKPLIQAPPVVPFSTGVQRAPRLATNGDPVPVLSPFNDWISSRVPSSRVIAWWSARCRARAGGRALGSRFGVGSDEGEQK